MAENRDRTQIAVALQVAAMGAAEYQLGLLKFDEDDLPMKTRVYSAEILADPNTIRYEFTVDDSTAFSRPWTAEAPMTKAPGPLYEYACHEGNYAMFNLLSGSRAEEKRREARSTLP